MTWVSHKKKEDIFCTVYFVIRKFFNIYVFTFSMYSVLNTPSEYTYLYTSKTLLHILLWLFLKSSKAFSVSLNRFSSLCFLNQKCYHCLHLNIRLRNCSIFKCYAIIFDKKSIRRFKVLTQMFRRPLRFPNIVLKVWCKCHFAFRCKQLFKLQILP